MLAGLFLDGRQRVPDVRHVSDLSPVSMRWFEQQKNVSCGFLILWSRAVMTPAMKAIIMMLICSLNKEYL